MMLEEMGKASVSSNSATALMTYPYKFDRQKECGCDIPVPWASEVCFIDDETILFTYHLWLKAESEQERKEGEKVERKKKREEEFKLQNEANWLNSGILVVFFFFFKGK